MPIFDWTRTDLFHPLEDGSTALFYEKDRIQDDYKEMADYILNNLHGMTFPGWEPERMAKLDELFEAYRPGLYMGGLESGASWFEEFII